MDGQTVAMGNNNSTVAVADPGGSLGSDEPPYGRIPVWWLKTLELVVSE